LIPATIEEIKDFCLLQILRSERFRQQGKFGEARRALRHGKTACANLPEEDWGIKGILDLQETGIDYLQHPENIGTAFAGIEAAMKLLQRARDRTRWWAQAELLHARIHIRAFGTLKDGPGGETHKDSADQILSRIDKFGPASNDWTRAEAMVARVEMELESIVLREERDAIGGIRASDRHPSRIATDLEAPRAKLSEAYGLALSQKHFELLALIHLLEAKILRMDGRLLEERGLEAWDQMVDSHLKKSIHIHWLIGQREIRIEALDLLCDMRRARWKRKGIAANDSLENLEGLCLCLLAQLKVHSHWKDSAPGNGTKERLNTAMTEILRDVLAGVSPSGRITWILHFIARTQGTLGKSGISDLLDWLRGDVGIASPLLRAQKDLFRNSDEWVVFDVLLRWTLMKLEDPRSIREADLDKLDRPFRNLTGEGINDTLERGAGMAHQPIAELGDLLPQRLAYFILEMGIGCGYPDLKEIPPFRSLFAKLNELEIPVLSNGQPAGLMPLLLCWWRTAIGYKNKTYIVALDPATYEVVNRSVKMCMDIKNRKAGPGREQARSAHLESYLRAQISGRLLVLHGRLCGNMEDENASKALVDALDLAERYTERGLQAECYYVLARLGLYRAVIGSFNSSAYPRSPDSTGNKERAITEQLGKYLKEAADKMPPEGLERSDENRHKQEAEVRVSLFKQGRDPLNSAWGIVGRQDDIILYSMILHQKGRQELSKENYAIAERMLMQGFHFAESKGEFLGQSRDDIARELLRCWILSAWHAWFMRKRWNKGKARRLNSENASWKKDIKEGLAREDRKEVVNRLKETLNSGYTDPAARHARWKILFWLEVLRVVDVPCDEMLSNADVKSLELDNTSEKRPTLSVLKGDILLIGEYLLPIEKARKLFNAYMEGSGLRTILDALGKYVQEEFQKGPRTKGPGSSREIVKLG
jgi:hypothetical protein